MRLMVCHRAASGFRMLNSESLVCIGIIPIVSIVVPVLVNQNLYYRSLTIKPVNQKTNYNGDSRYKVILLVLASRPG